MYDRTDLKKIYFVVPKIFRTASMKKVIFILFWCYGLVKRGYNFYIRRYFNKPLSKNYNLPHKDLF
jgi:hypothetical protein